MIKEYYKILNPSDLAAFVTLEISSPQKSDDMYKVAVSLHGLHDLLAPIQGDSEFEAIRNAIQFVNKIFNGLQESGSVIYLSNQEGKELYEIDFPKLSVVWD